MSPARDPLREAARRRPDAVAVEWAGRRVRACSYAELDERADRIAGALRRRGAGPDRRVALTAEPSPDGLAAVHGILRSGAVLAPAHPGWTRAERAAFLEAVAPVLEVTDHAISRPRADAAVVDPDEARTLLWTSGSSGSPRGVRLRLESHRASARAAAERLSLEPEDGWLGSLSLAHVGGLALVLRATWLGSRVVTLPGRFDAQGLLSLARAGRITHASLVPVMLRRLLEASGGARLPGGLRCLLVGGAATSPALLERALELGAPVALTYGLTEAASQVATAPPALVARCPGTVGPPLDGLEVRIGKDGEIGVRGPTVMDGYLTSGPAGRAGSRAADAGPEDRIRAEGSGAGCGAEEGRGPRLEPDGWLRTGDTGRLDEEGRLWITGRLSRRIVSGGVTVDPIEVEGVLERHPAVLEAVVLGTSDEEWGERVTAVVVPRPGERAAPELERTLDAWVRERLSGARRPRRWLFADELPRNPNGKVDREAVRLEMDARGTDRGGRSRHDEATGRGR